MIEPAAGRRGQMSRFLAEASDNGAIALLGGLLIVYLLVILAIVVFVILVWWKIFSKAGYSGAMALLMLIPIVNFVMMLILAFGEWPIHRELNHYRSMSAGGAYPPGSPMQGYAPRQ